MSNSYIDVLKIRHKIYIQIVLKFGRFSQIFGVISEIPEIKHEDFLDNRSSDHSDANSFKLVPCQS